MKRFSLILTLLLSLSACTPETGLVETLLECQDISLTWKNVVQVSYESETFQMGYNSSKNEYRVYDDRLAYWFTIRCSEKPASEGQTFTAEVSWTGLNRTKEFKNIQFTVKKVNDNGLIWLWNQSQSIGIIIRNQ